ncbi:MAG: HAMP domain-containing histidine kinase [Anaerolineales bacterium]|jgi:signal transduction histidine kinase|nr:HAMP domain-containing histidine kinase [Anaerolineales bacterium]GER80166.1 sensor histidine kinase [Candidatus Denitrolinea symbiosum]
MSIRLRFTLLYTFILALTLSIFGIALYTIQSQSTLDSLKQDLQMGANKTAEAALRSDSPDERPAPPPEDGQQPPVSFDEFSNGGFQAFPEREIARILDPNGNLVASPFGREEDELPLSEEGLQILQSGSDWWQTDTVSDEEMLIYSRPVVVDDEVVYIVQVARPLTERNRTLQSLVTTLLIAGSLITLIAFGIGWVFSGITLAPIHRMTQTAQKIGDERDFSRRVDYAGPQDEVGQLASTFNAMLTRLQDAFQKVEHSLEMQRDFVADVSHELRTPLTTLRGNLGLLRRNPSSEEQTDIINDMVDENDRLIRLVNDLLQLARADAGRSLTKETVDVSALLEETIRQARQLDSQRDISLESAPRLKVMGDRDAIKQVLLIALDNALKHSFGDVNITAMKNGSLVEIRVQDFGEGIPPEKLEHVFDRFYRGEETASIPGFGLGLSIAKTLVERQGGEIEMQSEVDRGSVLILMLQTAG